MAIGLPSSGQLLKYGLGGLVACGVASQLWWLYLRRRFALPAPLLRSFFGLSALLEMVAQPVAFWDELARKAEASGKGMAMDYLLGHPLIFVTDNALSQKIFSDTAHFQIFTHPNAKWLMGENNFVYYPPDKHKAVRRLMLTGLYEKSPLLSYVPTMEKIMRQHMAEIADSGRHVDCMLRLRVMAARSSQESFVGPYLSDAERTELAEQMLAYTMGYLSLPLPSLPGSGLKKAIDALRRMHRILARVFLDGMAYARTGQPPRCVLDYWCTEIHTKTDEAFNKMFSEKHWTETICDALFAAQDATVSALCWTVDVLQRHPQEFAACRAEVDRVLAAQQPPAKDVSELASVFTSLTYASDVAYEVLRFKPPVPMLPHIARQDLELHGVRVPAGTMVVASIDKAAPKKPFSPATNTDKAFEDTITFGAGAHKCPGRYYAATSVALFVALLAAEYDIEPLVQNAEDSKVYFPTLFPKHASFKFVPRRLKN